MKILYTSHRPEIGGGELSFFDIINNIDYNIVTPVLAMPHNPDIQNYITNTNILIENIKYPPVKKFSFSSLNTLYKIIHENEIGLIHCNTTRSVIYNIIISKITGIPLIWHNRGTDKRSITEMILGYNVNKLIGISNSVTQAIIEQGIPKDKIELIYNGVEIDRNILKKSNKEFLLNKYKIDSSKKTVGLIGRFTKEKGHKYLIEIIPELLKKFYNNIIFFFIGADNFGESNLCEIKNMIKKNKLEKHIIFTGYIDNIYNILPCLDSVVIPSEREAFGRVVLECWTSKVPVTAFAVDGLKEIITHNYDGLLVNPFDKKELCESIKNILINENLRKKLTINGLESLKKFDIKNTVKKILKIYYDLYK